MLACRVEARGRSLTMNSSTASLGRAKSSSAMVAHFFTIFSAVIQMVDWAPIEFEAAAICRGR